MKIFSRLLQFLVPLRWWIALATLLGCLTIASNVALLSMAAYLIAAAALVPFLALLTIPMFIVRLMGAIRPLARYAERLVSHSVIFRLLASLRVRVYDKIEPQAPAHLLHYRSGDLLARLTTDIDELQNVYLRILSPIAVALVIALLTWGIFLLFHPLLAWVALLFLVASGLALPLLAVRLTRHLGQRQLSLRAQQKAHIVDGLQGMTDLLANGYEHAQQCLIQQLENELGQNQRRMAHVSGLQEALHDLLMNLGVWTILFLGIVLISVQAINAVYLGFLSLLLLASYEAILPLAQAFQMLGHALAAGERMFALTDAPPGVRESEKTISIPEQEAGGYTLEFEHVSFSYETNENRPAIQDVSFQLRPGHRVALVGPSGAGKSTLMRLALRFQDPTQGMIRLNGLDIHELTLADLRSLFGVVTQDTYLFNDTLRRNLRLARPQASDEELMQVLEQAQLGEFVRQLPEGLDTWIGEQGLRLSGGERQRLAFARVLLKDAPILILDEATANLDPLTEQALLDTLNGLIQGRTTLLITHRLVDMEHINEILVLNQGLVQEHGTHQELLAANGLYRQLFDEQRQFVG
jgi:ATP-binding cassette subfamily C protein CydC